LPKASAACSGVRQQVTSGGLGSSDRNLSGISGKFFRLIEHCVAFFVKFLSLIVFALAPEQAQSDAKASEALGFFLG
jgi:hypothetical protein